jgi:hypothetical protein
VADDERPKRSWREIDAMRDKSRSRDERGPRGGNRGGERTAAAAAQKSYRAALERAFENGTLAELAKTLSRVEEPKPPAPKEPPEPAEPAAAAAAPAPAPNGEAPAAAAPAPAPEAKDPERENRNKMLQRIREAEGKEPISRAIDAFEQKYGKLPDDFEVLTKALAHRDDEHISAALDRLQAMVARGERPRRGRSLVAQLRMLEDTHGDPDIRRRAAAVRSPL